MFPEGRILDFVIVGVIALIVVGPKDLPILMRRVGQFLAKMRAMAAEFRASFDELARQSELDELRREVEALRAGRPLESAIVGEQAGDMHKVFEDIHAGLRETGAQLHPPMSSPPRASAEVPAVDPGPPALPLATVVEAPAVAAPKRSRSRPKRKSAGDETAPAAKAETPT